jgi:hypothetical protein
VHRSGPSSTASLVSALAPLGRYGLSPLQQALVGFGRFPVAGPSVYTDDWLEYRSFPTPHLHQGIDIAAAYGTPLRSPAAGMLTYSNSDPDGYGLTAIVTGSDGTTYVLAHMSATVLGLSSGRTVSEGQVIGFVGDSGDATGPHLHFEIHPGGGPGIDAKPVLDRWLMAATAAAPALVAAYAAARSRPAPPTSAAAAPVIPPAAPAGVSTPAEGPTATTRPASRGLGGRWLVGLLVAVLLGLVLAVTSNRTARRHGVT